MRLQGKIAVITGASMGIGEEIARLFLREGAKVVLASRELERVEAARQRIGGSQENSLAVSCDVRRREEIAQLLRITLDRFGCADVWVNNAGFGIVDSVERMDMQECRRMFDTNLFGTVEAMQLVAPVMRKQGGGAIINISSVAGHIAVPYMAAYGATKHALNCFSRAARLELRKDGINIINVCPGRVRTDFNRNVVQGTENRRVGGEVQRGVTPERVARAVLRAYAYNRRELIVPWSNRLLAGVYWMAPAVIEWGMMRMLGGSNRKKN